MNTYGGGWTLVWSYSFTNYAHLNDGSNAITLETTRQTGPNQEQHEQLAGVSSRTWQPGFWREGDINCSIIKRVTGPSHELVPSRFSPNQNNSYGPLLCTNKLFITALTIILMVTLKTIGLPMILSEEMVLTK